MTRDVDYSPDARADIEDALNYLERFSPAAADRLAEEIDQRCQLLASQPGIGRPRDDIKPGLRTVVVQRYVIIYRSTDTTLEVVPVVHGSRDILALFAED